MKILLLDIETAPNTAFVWGIFNENIPIQRIKETSYVMCVSAKWLHEDEVMFYSIYHDSEMEMLTKVHALLDEADCVVHFNGKRFDIPTLNKEFILKGFPPPAPYKQVDLLLVARSTFKFPSNKLDFIAQKLGIGQKKETNFQLWIDCMNYDRHAWKKMKEYNIHDVILLEKAYLKFRPWIRNHANHSILLGEVCCPNCGSKDFQRRGFHVSNAGRYQRYQCTACGNWFKSGRTLAQGIAERSSNISA